MTRLLVIMGSGETTPTMVTPHQRVLARLGDELDAVLLDTPYGFQENADDITERALAYFRRNVGHEVRAVSLRRAGQDALSEEAALADLRAADWVFAGPGSPSYVLRQWRDTAVPEVLRGKLRDGGALVFASAAACVVGRRAIPVYEVYKVGEEPHWLEGLDLVSVLDLKAVVIPHYDNAEGGTHDTRYCYLGERRLQALETALDADEWILGVDEHTAVVIHADTGRVELEGRGGLTVRTRDGSRRWEAGEELTLEALRAAAAGRPHDGTPATVAGAPDRPTLAPDRTPFLEEVDGLRQRFDAALKDGDALGAGQATLELVAAIRAWSSDTEQSDQMDRAHGALRQMVVQLARIADAGLHDHGDVVAPFVDTLLEVRDDARAQQRFDLADAIRDRLTASEVEIHDTEHGTHWHYGPEHDPDRDAH
ncbi:MAG TPA: Type 1 glutamine amidotransferase-like domain-containing protein [Nitriliruptorales bacterium]